jgi:hypothetical protein
MFQKKTAPLVRNDNAGPPPISEVLSNWQILQAEFPNATIVASTWDNFTNLLYPLRTTLGLPVVTGEIGDTWVCVSIEQVGMHLIVLL